VRGEIEDLVREQAGDRDFLLGFSSLYGLVDGGRSDLIYGISVGLRLQDDIVDELAEGPTERYLAHYHSTNRGLDRITGVVAGLLRSRGAKAEVIPATINREPADPEDPYFTDLSASFSHKMAATRAGLGWIGKTALFVSDRFGPRVRLVTVLTDHPLEVGVPCEMSLCGECLLCVEACPAQAADGMEWFPGLERDRFFDAARCRTTCIQMTESRTGQRGTVCGICMAVCPVGIEFRTPAAEDEWI